MTSGPAIERAGDLVSILTNLKAGDVLFIDEIHRLNRIIEEVLYPAMEDFAVDIVIGKGPAARTMRINLPRFTLVGATTRLALLTGPLRDRFRLGAASRLLRSRGDGRDRHPLGRRFSTYRSPPRAPSAIARRVPRNTPRRQPPAEAGSRLGRSARRRRRSPTRSATDALTMLNIDELGLDEVDRRILSNDRREVRRRSGRHRYAGGGDERRDRHDHGRLRTVSNPARVPAAYTTGPDRDQTSLRTLEDCPRRRNWRRASRRSCKSLNDQPHS